MSLKTIRTALLAGLLLLTQFVPAGLRAQGQIRTADDATSFAFARYLGTGFYSTGDSRVFVVQFPLRFQLKPMTPHDFGLVLRSPLTVGLTDFSLDGITGGDVPGIEDVATLSLVPGLEYEHPVLSNWKLAPFFDLGLAHNLRSSRNVRILGIGIKSFVDFKHGENRLTLGNRWLYADESKVDIEGNSNFAVFETGLDYRFHTDIQFGDRRLDFSLYYINYYYFNDLVILKILDNPIKLVNKNEIGFTFSLPTHGLLPDNPRLGFGIQFAGDLRIYRIVFGMPFF